MSADYFNQKVRTYHMSTGKITDVFVTAGLPSITYVKRKKGHYENSLNRALDEGGQLCLITGPSKTGKSTLYKEVLAQRNELPILISCSRNLTTDQIWRQILEKIDFQRVTKKDSKRISKLETKAAGEAQLGWSWLAKAVGKAEVSGSRQIEDSSARETILSDCGVHNVIECIKLLEVVIVIEDFHYLQEDVKIDLFQQWKAFVDAKISIIVLETSHRAVDIANSNKDLVGRISHLDISGWDVPDLVKIVELGFQHLNQLMPRNLSNLMAKEAVGLPIVIQQVCLELFSMKGLATNAEIRKKKQHWTNSDIRTALHNVARVRYSVLENGYNTLVKGPREAARRYRTYEIVLSCFSRDPITFSLSRQQIEERIAKLDIVDSEIPPKASINSTLGALKKFQEKRGLELLEWRPSDDRLYILEPVFLYYVRWKREPVKKSEQLDFFEIVIGRASLKNLNWKFNISTRQAG